jgi:hypothetical protein
VRLMLVLALATLVLGATAAEASAAPVKNPLSLELVGTCSDGSAYDAFSPARGHAVIDTLSHGLQITEQLSVSDPLDEIGGSFSVTGPSYAPLGAKGLLTECVGAVVGTQSVTFTAEVLKTPI